METCENCGAVIPETETPAVWHDRVVCRKCRQELSAPAAERQPAADTQSPGYGGLRISGSLLRVLGIATAAISCLIMVLGVATNRPIIFAGMGAGGLLYGVLICASGEVFLALRDIAISTWSLRNRS